MSRRDQIAARLAELAGASADELKSALTEFDVRDLVAVLAAGGGGGSQPGASRWIDCGIVDLDAVVRAGSVTLVGAAEGRLIAGVRFTADGWVDPPVPIYLITPNTVGASGFGYVSAADTGADTVGIVHDGAFTALPDGRNQYVQVLDGGPLVAASSIPSREFFAPGVWQAGHAYGIFDAIIDSNDHVQEVNTNGVSGGSEPVWDDGGGTTNDGSVAWADLGAVPQGSVHVLAEVIELGAGGFTPPQPATLTFVQQPTNAVHEAPISPTVTVLVLDADGNPYADMYSPTLTLRLLGDGTLLPNYVASVYADPATGIAAFPGINILQPGSYRLQATLYPSVNVPAVLSDEFTITA